MKASEKNAARDFDQRRMQLARSPVINGKANDNDRGQRD